MTWIIFKVACINSHYSHIDFSYFLIIHNFFEYMSHNSSTFIPKHFIYRDYTFNKHFITDYDAIVVANSIT